MYGTGNHINVFKWTKEPHTSSSLPLMLLDVQHQGSQNGNLDRHKKAFMIVLFSIYGYCLCTIAIEIYNMKPLHAIVHNSRIMFDMIY